MIIDGTLKLSDAQVVSSTTTSTDTWNRGDKSSRLFNPRIRLTVQVVGAGAGTGTIQAVVQASDDNATWKQKYTSAAVTGDDAKAGTMLVAGLPLLMDIDEQYIRINYVVSGTLTTSVKVSAFFCPDGVPYQTFDVA